MPGVDVSDVPVGVVSVSAAQQQMFDGQVFPLILSPATSHADRDNTWWRTWIKDNLDALKTLLFKYGAILFRDFPLAEPVDFDLFAKSFGYIEFPYLGGSSIRRPVVGNCYTSTEAPPDAVIPFHHEMAHVENFPKILFFYCDVAPPVGGETPIALSHVVYQRLVEREPELVVRLAAEGARYSRVAPEEDDIPSALGRSWKSTFLANDRDEAIRNATAAGFDLEWFEDGSVRYTTKPLPAIRVYERTGRTTFFNSINNCYQGWQDSRNDRFLSVKFPNGDQMPAGPMKTVKEVLDEAGVSCPWEKGDVVLIDNRQVMHARNHFAPPRRILASLFKEETVEGQYINSDLSKCK